MKFPKVGNAVSLTAMALCWTSGAFANPDETMGSSAQGSAAPGGTTTIAESRDPSVTAAPVADIVVTGSRITTAGYKSPTPVTVIGEQQLKRDAKVSIGDSIRELPAVGSSSSPNNGYFSSNISGGVTGLDTVNLRQLGTQRTLVLVDGQRVVASNVTGEVDLGTIPTSLVQRVDVVTGGASAAWGSDAVAGVVNLVLNRKFEGVSLDAEGGEDYEWDHQSYRLQAAAGTSFAEGRGHLIGAVSYLNSPDVIFASQRSWNHYTELVPNPAYAAGNGQPRLIHADNVGLSSATPGGLITGPTCLAAVTNGVCSSPNPLVNIQFLGSNATPTPFDPGIVSGAISAGGSAVTDYAALDDLAVPYRTFTAFGYGSYDVTDSITASVQFNYGSSWAENNTTSASRLGTLVIQRDNAFLPESIRSEMSTLGLNSITIGTLNTNNLSPNQYSFNNFINNSVGVPVSIQKRQLIRGVATLSGKLGENWSWNTYYQHGQSRFTERTPANMIASRYAFAVDAVRDPTTGATVCRATLPGPGYNAAAAGCVPLDVFGTNVASQAAINYVNGSRNNFQVLTLKEDVASASAQGKLGVGLPAGPIAVAFGGEYRREAASSVVDDGAKAKIYSFGNFQPFSGSYDVKEGFLELDVPLLKNSVVDSLSLNAAGRVTDYSTSGTVETWKLGLTSQVNPSIRLRGTVSRDIRAPNLSELYNGGVSVNTVGTDPHTGTTVALFATTSGNPALKPEIARTYTAGIVLTPSFAPRLSMSLDYYSISIHDAIYTASAPQVTASCAAGEQAFCNQLDFNGPGGQLSAIRQYPLNVSAQKTSGLDFQLDDSLDALGGVFQTHVVGNYILTQTQTVFGVATNYAGSIGPDSAVPGIPRFRGTVAETYSRGRLSFTVQGRLIGAAKLNNAWGPLDVDNNHVPFIGYMDLRASYQIIKQAQVYIAVDNLLNQDPPNLAASSSQPASNYLAPVRGDIYDILGQSYRVGVRFSF